MTVDLKELDNALNARHELEIANNGIEDAESGPAPFEGPEKLLEIWFAPCYTSLKCEERVDPEKCGLRAVPRTVWEDMLDIVKCKVLNVIHGKEIDAYLLSESSLFIWPHKLILKTCGRTLNLLGLPRILAIAAEHAGLNEVYQLFYSRKSFMFPEQQFGPHKDWSAEVHFLDDIFRDRGGGSAYTVGKVNGDHWLLYIAGPGAAEKEEENPTPALPTLDYTVEILMSDLSATARKPFFYPSASNDQATEDGSQLDPAAIANNLTLSSGISSLFPPHLTTLDAYAFDPCGYSSNALIESVPLPPSPLTPTDSMPALQGEGYYTIHVTPEEDYSYASFECNVALPSFSPDDGPLESTTTANANPSAASRIPDLRTLVQRVVQIFQPGRLTLTVFMSSSEYQDAGGDTEIEAAQKAFKTALRDVRFENVGEGGKDGEEVVNYKRTDKINYEFGSYDLAFATFERKKTKS